MTRRHRPSIRSLCLDLKLVRAWSRHLDARLADSTERLRLTLQALANLRRAVVDAYARPADTTVCTLLAAEAVVSRETAFLAAWNSSEPNNRGPSVRERSEEVRDAEHGARVPSDQGPSGRNRRALDRRRAPEQGRAGRGISQEARVTDQSLDQQRAEVDRILKRSKRNDDEEGPSMVSTVTTANLIEDADRVSAAAHKSIVEAIRLFGVDRISGAEAELDWAANRLKIAQANVTAALKEIRSMIADEKRDTAAERTAELPFPGGPARAKGGKRG